MEQTAIQPITPDTSMAISPQSALTSLRELEALVAQVMKEGEHYGVIPGTEKRTLLKAGAELLGTVYGITAAEVEIVERIESWTVEVTATTFPLFRYLVKTTFVNSSGRIVAFGYGEANSYETKYRWRKGERICPKCQKPAIIAGKAEYGGGWLCWKQRGGCGAKFTETAPEIVSQVVGNVPNVAIFDQVNTLLKMAKKRSFVDGMLIGTRTSGIFTQDMEDFATLEDVKRHEEKAATTVTAADEAKPSPVQTIGDTLIPMGPNKGKRLADVSRGTLEAQLKWLRENNRATDYADIVEKYLNEPKKEEDPFEGAFDRAKREAVDVKSVDVKDEAKEAKETLDNMFGPADGPAPRSGRLKNDLGLAIQAAKSPEALTKIAQEVASRHATGDLTDDDAVSLSNEIDAVAERLAKAGAKMAKPKR